MRRSLQISLLAVSLCLVLSGCSTCWASAAEDQGAPADAPEAVMCTMEAMICPDGSAVGRTGPNCEFAPCPGADNTDPQAAPHDHSGHDHGGHDHGGHDHHGNHDHGGHEGHGHDDSTTSSE